MDPPRPARFPSTLLSLSHPFALLDRFLDMQLPYLTLVHALSFSITWGVACGCSVIESDATKSCQANNLVEGNPVGFASTDTFRSLALSHPRQPLLKLFYSLNHAYGHDACGAVCLDGSKCLLGPCTGASAGMSLVARTSNGCEEAFDTSLWCSAGKKWQ